MARNHILPITLRPKAGVQASTFVKIIAVPCTVVLEEPQRGSILYSVIASESMAGSADIG